jgi:hypothetical protein
MEEETSTVTNHEADKALLFFKQKLIERVRGLKCRCSCDANHRLDKVINIIEGL